MSTFVVLVVVSVGEPVVRTFVVVERTVGAGVPLLSGIHCEYHSLLYEQMEPSVQHVDPKWF